MATARQAMQSVLAAEHAACYLYGVLGGQTSMTTDPDLFALVGRAFEAHRARRDEVTAWLRKAGAVPVAAAPAYEIPGPLGTPTRVTAIALDVERRCAGIYSAAVGHTQGRDRRWAIAALTDAAVRELDFRGSPETFPGIAKLTDRRDR